MLLPDFLHQRFHSRPVRDVEDTIDKFVCTVFSLQRLQTSFRSCYAVDDAFIVLFDNSFHQLQANPTGGTCNQNNLAHIPSLTDYKLFLLLLFATALISCIPSSFSALSFLATLRKRSKSEKKREKSMRNSMLP
ncbi:hypothetical protein WN66_03318 [Saccharomyces cerevisiae]|nr:hypothetical protein WN66_03318 [Saccharomyces cerevisiae]